MDEAGRSDGPGAGDPSPEILLRHLVRTYVYADHANALAVTLLCGGRIVAGDIVTPYRWATEMKSFVASGQGSAVEFMLETLVAFGDAFASTLAPAADDEITTFYLINAAVALSGDVAVPVSAVRRPWAVQSAQVVAWSLGTVLP